MRVAGSRASAIGILIAVALYEPALGSADSRLQALGSDDVRVVQAAVVELEHAPASAELADELFTAARACEDKLVDPPRALALYERILRDAPGARVAAAAERRAERLRAELGANNEHAKEATELARLVAQADRMSPEEVETRARALVDASWPGAPNAALWRAEWERRRGQFETAEASYLFVVQHWPSSPQAVLGRRGAAGAALDGHAWDRAAELATALPSSDPSDAIVRDELLATAARGNRRVALYRDAWIALALALAGLLGSLADATFRGGRRWPRLRPPIEVLFLAPVAAVLVAVSFTAHKAIAPAVLRISIVGVVLAWLSGVTLDLVRARGRSVRTRAIAHIVACAIGVVAIGYIAMTRDGLLDLLAETVRFGPDA